MYCSVQGTVEDGGREGHEFQKCMILLSPKLQRNLSRACLRLLGLDEKLEQTSNVLNSEVYNAWKKLCVIDWFLNLYFFQLIGFHF